MKKMFSSTHIRYKDNPYKINPETFGCNEVCNICGDCVNQVLHQQSLLSNESYSYDEFVISVWFTKIKHWIKHTFINP